MNLMEIPIHSGLRMMSRHFLGLTMGAERKARILQSRGRPLPHVPHNTPEGEVGKPEGLSGSQTEETGLAGEGSDFTRGRSPGFGAFRVLWCSSC